MAPRFHQLIRIGPFSIGQLGENVAFRWFGITILTVSVEGARRLQAGLRDATDNAGITRSIYRANGYAEDGA